MTNFRDTMGDPSSTQRIGTVSGPAPQAEVTLTASDGQVYQLRQRENYIGRVANNDIQVDNPKVSRQHARILASDGLVLLEDLNSTNGTYLNHQPVTSPVPLKDGDVIQLGDITMRVALHEVQTPQIPQIPQIPPMAAPTGETRVLDLRSAMAGPAPTGERIIRLSGIVKKYKTGESEVTILKGINLEIMKGDFVALLGPSGCGKSTTLNMIIGIDRPDAGEVYVGDQRVDRMKTNQMAQWRGRHIGVVFQFFQLLPTLSVIENVMLPMQFTKTFKKSERRDRAMECLKLVGMDEKATRLPSALSGGQQQRVAIARSLACDPPMIVADEPTGNLDSKASQQIFKLFTELNTSGKTIVMVTHDPVLARAIPRRIEMLDGEIVG